MPDAGRRQRVGQGWRLPRPVRTFGGRLMEQQVWCWGKDVEFPDGNLLLRFGFERLRDCTAEARSTCYRLDRDQVHVCLWGFGMFFGCRNLGGLYLDRFNFYPQWAPVESLATAIHWPDDLPVFSRPRGAQQWQRAHKLWKASLSWIANYETWVRNNVDIDYRRDCVKAWLRPIVRAEKTASAWRFLSGQGWERVNQPITQVLRRYTLPTGLQ